MAPMTYDETYAALQSRLTLWTKQYREAGMAGDRPRAADLEKELRHRIERLETGWIYSHVTPVIVDLLGARAALRDPATEVPGQPGWYAAQPRWVDRESIGALNDVGYRTTPTADLGEEGPNTRTRNGRRQVRMVVETIPDEVIEAARQGREWAREGWN
jgi:hypothetical protein